MSLALFDEIEKYTPGVNSGNINKLRNNEPFQGDFSALLSGKERQVTMSVRGKLWRFGLSLTVLIGVGLFFIARSIDLQLLSKEKFAGYSSGNAFREIKIQADRGLILADDSTPLARNKPAFDLELDVKGCISEVGAEQCLKNVERLAEKVPIDVPEVVKEVQAGVATAILALNLAKDTLLAIEPHLKDYAGVYVSMIPQRDYTYPECFSHVLGYVGLSAVSGEPEIVGRSGLEKEYQKYLRGIAGGKVVSVDSTNNTSDLLSQKDPLPGKNISTYLDARVQAKACELLRGIVEKENATGGAVVAQDPSTGGIIALVSYPSFDTGEMSGGIRQSELSKLENDQRRPFFNRAISGVYPPGSVFKMVVASGALHEGVVTEDTTVFDPGYLQVGSYVFKNWKVGGHGYVDLRRALQVSNDTYFYTLGGGYGDIAGLGIDRLAKWAKEFGFGQKTGIDIDGESAGYFPTGAEKAWYLGDTYITAIGQGDVLVTPLQINNMVTYFANGGYLYVPKIVRSIDGVGNPKSVIFNEDLISDEHYQAIREGMRKVVNPGGTAYPLFDFVAGGKKIELAGKTGTAEFNDTQGNPATHAWFSVFGPYDRPSIALTVFLEGGGSGADDAAPIARDILKEWFER